MALLGVPGFTRDYFQAIHALHGFGAQAVRLSGLSRSTLFGIVTGLTRTPSALSLERAALAYLNLGGVEQRGILLTQSAISGRDPFHTDFLSRYARGQRFNRATQSFMPPTQASREGGQSWLADRIEDIQTMLRESGVSLLDFLESGGISGQRREGVA